MPLELYLAFVAASAVVLVIPGPTVMLLISRGLADGKKNVLPLVAGVTLGDLTAITLSMLGLGALLAASAALFTVVKWIGAVYLVWLGVKMLREKGGALAVDPLAAKKARFAQAFCVTVLNPKSIMFFIAFLPQFVSHAQPVAPQLVLLGATFTVLAAVNAYMYAALAARAGGRLSDPRFVGVIRKAGGGVLVGAGVLTAAMRRAG
ncbi:LysE family translocator [Desulfolutivibrio sulfoxidireducens]|uniref:LysE family translocator n=1 Tax=Desulfolutivibrio sulfoxidireducens TaxID=2773299 RepID=UPI00159E331D|nr:LysE family translocator [Desulfolutivibrio sulfoxidireducens]QLA17194.1 LysE family translocator [Desulfolutivibrio sulfoxidireducens]